MKRGLMLFLEIALIVGLGIWVYISLSDTVITHPNGVQVTAQLADAWDKAELYQADDGKYYYVIRENDGRKSDLSAEHFAERLYQGRVNRSWYQKFLNVSNVAGLVWVAVGFLGQLLFTGRMIVQWLASEKKKKSVVPPIFWWMSLGGSTMLMIYFFWRRDPIGLLGQSFGWFIYIRNLYMIYKPHPTTDTQAVAAQE